MQSRTITMQKMQAVYGTCNLKRLENIWTLLQGVGTSNDNLTHFAYRRHMATENWVSIGLNNGPLPDDTKLFLEPMFAYNQYGSVLCTWEQFHTK